MYDEQINCIFETVCVDSCEKETVIAKAQGFYKSNNKNDVFFLAKMVGCHSYCKVCPYYIVINGVKTPSSRVIITVITRVANL